MLFTKGALAELREIYREEFKKEITDDEAAEMGGRVVEFVQIVVNEMNRRRKLGLPMPSGDEDPTPIAVSASEKPARATRPIGFQVAGLN